MAKTVKVHGERACSVDASPREVDAGGEVTIAVRASCPHGCDLQGHGVSIRNQDGTELAVAEFAELRDDAYVTGPVVLPAPLDVGEHRFRAVLPAVEKDGVVHEEAAAEFAFATKAHDTSVNIWGMPSAVAAGEPFGFTVGIRCSAGCKLAGRQLSAFDHEGAQVAAGHLLDEAWPGTTAVYFTELRARAPLETGDHRWRVETPGSDSGVPHAAGSSTLALKVVAAPDHEVTVVAFDAEKQVPIKGAHILLHPYRALTDDKGVAKVKVAKGTYKLFVSGFNYVAYENVIDVADNVTIRAELAVEPEGQEDYR
jgi:hypothetical protein